MEIHELETVMHELQAFMQHYGKSLPDGAARKWRQFFSGYDFDKSMAALEYHVRREKQAPRISDIEEILQKSKKTSGEIQDYFYKGNCPLTRKALEQDKIHEEKTRAGIAGINNRIQSAWIIYNRLSFGDTFIPSESRDKSVDMTKEQALEIVNAEAARLNIPEAIDPKFRIESYWRNHEA